MMYSSENSAFRIGSDDNLIFQVDNDGTIWYRLDGEIKKLEDEKEMSLMLLSVISGRYGNKYNTKEELMTDIIKSYRDGKINDILK